MSDVLDGLRERYESAKNRLTVAQQRHQASAAELNAATAEHNVWAQAVSLETRERDRLAAEAKQGQMPSSEIASEAQAAPTEITSQVPPESPHVAGGEQESINQTAIVRDALRLRPSGMTPADLWKAHQKEISSRPYLYSILKRMRDKDEVALRRGKYILKPKAIEAKAAVGTEVQTVQ